MPRIGDLAERTGLITGDARPRDRSQLAVGDHVELAPASRQQPPDRAVLVAEATLLPAATGTYGDFGRLNRELKARYWRILD
ncbi:MAG: hypothetical protein M3546_04510 [Actinomycetota bacterium]|nr:hypothetical protein [Actinomycetota bacterium]